MPTSRANNSWGYIFGLAPTDLSLDQLNKVDFKKLIEFVGLDSRVPHLVATGIKNEAVDNISYLKRADLSVIKTYPNIVAEYNRFIERHPAIIQNSWDRPRYVYWELLNDANRKIEIDRWQSSETSIVNDNQVDYDWLEEYNPDIVSSLVEKYTPYIISQDKLNWRYYSYDSICSNLIRNISKPRLELLLPAIFEGKSSQFKLLTLQNKHLPEKYILLALRILAKRKYSQTIAAVITKEMIEKLPTMTRLKVLERIAVDIVGIEDSDQFRSLMFGSFFKYPERVEKVIKSYEYRNKENE